MGKKILGIDEAGRGPVVGSLFVGGVLIDEKNQEELEELGLKDSKLLSDEQREKFVPQIKEVAEKTLVKEITAQQIDELRETINLNKVEFEVFMKIIEETEPDKVVIDLLEKDGEKYKIKVKNRLGEKFKNLEIVAEHKADVNYPIVSAASILAKSAREENVRKIEEKYDAKIRTGYSHDEDTIDFLKNYLEENKELPPEARESWETCKKLVREFGQSKVDDF